MVGQVQKDFGELHRPHLRYKKSEYLGDAAVFAGRTSARSPCETSMGWPCIADRVGKWIKAIPP